MKEVTIIDEGRYFALQPDAKYPHLGATYTPDLGQKLHLSAIRNKLAAI